MQTVIRKATTNDFNSLDDLFAETDWLHADHLPHIFHKPADAAGGPDRYRELIADENVALLVAEAGGKLVGFAHAIVKDAPAISIFVPRRYAVVEGIVVKSGFQNRGTGRMLMDKVQEWALAKGASSIELNVYEFNRNAIQFYEGLGYRSLSRKMAQKLERDETPD